MCIFFNDKSTILIFQVKAQSNTSHASEAPSTVAIARQIALEEGDLTIEAKEKHMNIIFYQCLHFHVPKNMYKTN